MIRFATNNDIDGIISLWQEAFGETRNEIKFFLENKFKPKNTLIFDESGEIASMLFLLEGEMCIKDTDYQAYYLYAACTAKKYRGRGFMSALLNAAKKAASDRNIRFISLLPAEDSLYNYYANFGYLPAFSKKVLTVKRCEMTDEIKLNFEPVSAASLENIRENSFKDIDRFKWDNDAVNFAFKHTKMYGGIGFVSRKGYALYGVIDSKLYVKECAFTHENLTDIIAFLFDNHKVDEIEFSLPYNFECNLGKTVTKRNGMVLPVDSEAQNIIRGVKDAYLGLALD